MAQIDRTYSYMIHLTAHVSCFPDYPRIAFPSPLTTTHFFIYTTHRYPLSISLMNICPISCWVTD